MANQNNTNESVLVGYVNQPTLNIRFSLTEQELRDMAKLLVQSKDATKPGRVYCTLKTGTSKAGKAYSFIDVYDPNASSGQTFRKSANAPVAQQDDLPF